MDKGGQGQKSKVIVDASVGAKWIVPGEPWEEHATILKEKIVSGDLTAYAPSLFLYEIASIVVKSMAIGALTPKDCSEALDAIKLLGINIQPILWEDMIEIVDIAIKTNLTVYDSTYLYLCKKLNAKLVTADEELKNRGEKVADVCFIEDFI